MRSAATFLVLFILPLSAASCVQRQLTVQSNPTGALLYLNGVEIGRTPVTRDFIWYGKYDVELRKAGYQTLKTIGNVPAPWWQWVPIDLMAEFLPLHDHKYLKFTLQPPNPQASNPQTLLEHAKALGSQLESSPFTQFHVTTAPTTRHAPATTRATTTTAPAATLPAS